jgi:chromosome segregation ATPase
MRLLGRNAKFIYTEIDISSFIERYILMMSEERIARLEQSFVMLTELAQSSDERMDALAEAQANTETRVAALADAQIRTEDRMAELTVTVSGLTTAMTTLAERMAELAEAQAHTDQRLDALIDIISQGRQGENNP